MKRLLVIADDFTGAAEIAGVGHRFGLSANLVRGPAELADAELTVIDTDSRSLSQSEAADTVVRSIDRLNFDSFDLIYKKMDSVLRGPVRAEVLAILGRTGLKRALLAPQNPSRGRTIIKGVYRIDGVPLEQTAFRDDPGHPARSSVAADVLRIESGDPIELANADSIDQMRAIAASLNAHTLPAGSGDFFQAILEKRGLLPTRPPIAHLPPGPTLFVCGSASGYSNELPSIAANAGMVVSSMPADARTWACEITRHLSSGRRVLMTVGRPVDRTPGAADALLATLTIAVTQVLSLQPVTNLLVDGGATAASICKALGWSQFHIKGELAPGAVMMRVEQTNLAVKPGSYRWPGGVFEECAESR